uniref:Putative ORF22-like protein n=1 Tax=Lygus hesperus TaxID=30085 RepID=A0A0A9XNJ9_LYGHE
METGSQYTIVDVLHELNAYLANNSCSVREFLCNFSQSVVCHALCDIVCHMCKGNEVSIADVIHEYLDIDDGNSILSLALKVMANAGFLSPQFINLFHTDSVYSMALRVAMNLLISDLSKVVDPYDPITHCLVLLLDLLCKAIRMWLERCEGVCDTCILSPPYRDFLRTFPIPTLYTESYFQSTAPAGFTKLYYIQHRRELYLDNHIIPCRLIFDVPNCSLYDSAAPDSPTPPILDSLFYILLNLFRNPSLLTHQTLQLVVDAVDAVSDSDPSGTLHHVVALHWFILHSAVSEDYSMHHSYRQNPSNALLLLRQMVDSVDCVCAHIRSALTSDHSLHICDLVTQDVVGSCASTAGLLVYLRWIVANIPLLSTSVTHSAYLLNTYTSGVEVQKDCVDARSAIVRNCIVLYNSIFVDPV